MSHQLQPTSHPPNRIKKALRPACSPSPCREWKVSTTGRAVHTGGCGTMVEGAGNQYAIPAGDFVLIRCSANG